MASGGHDSHSNHYGSERTRDGTISGLAGPAFGVEMRGGAGILKRPVPTEIGRRRSVGKHRGTCSPHKVTVLLATTRGEEGATHICGAPPHPSIMTRRRTRSHGSSTRPHRTPDVGLPRTRVTQKNPDPTAPWPGPRVPAAEDLPFSNVEGLSVRSASANSRREGSLDDVVADTWMRRAQYEGISGVLVRLAGTRRCGISNPSRYCNRRFALH